MWLADLLKNNISFGTHSTLAFIIIVALSILVRYFFASGSAYIVAMVPVFAMLANVSGAPVMLTALALLFSNSYGGMVLTMAVRRAPLYLVWDTTILSPGGLWAVYWHC